jgi:ATP-dependent DNA helicase RecQ
LVVSPLVSLIADQLASLNSKLCVRAQGVVARLDVDEPGLPVATRSLGGAELFVFVTPEFLKVASEAVRAMRLSLIVVDEAHCISGHGLSFREDYRELSLLRTMHPDVPICALTATAPSEVARDVVQLLGLRGDAVVRAPIDRANLRLEVVARRAKMSDDVEEIRRLLGEAKGIVYFQTRGEVEKGAELLKARGIDIAAYHAGLDSNVRQSVQELFVTGGLRCIAATIAFGMGVDVPGIRCVVHYGLPGTLENYAQEIGRAGRDGSASTCALFWASSDAAARSRAGKDNLDPRLAERGLRAMLDFAQSNGCLRRYLASYFDDPDVTSTCAARGGESCSVCHGSGAGVYVDYGDDARLLLRTMKLVRTGAAKQLDYHMGRSRKELTELRQRFGDACFGAGAGRSAEFWKELHAQLRATGYVHCNEFGACVLSDSGSAALESDCAVVLPEITAPRNLEAGRVCNALESTAVATVKRQRVEYGGGVGSAGAPQARWGLLGRLRPTFICGERWEERHGLRPVLSP